MNTSVAGLIVGLPSQNARLAPTDAFFFRMPTATGAAQHVHIMAAPGDDNSVRAGADAMEALAKLNKVDASRLMVVDDHGRLAGVLALRDLLGFLSIKLDLEGA